MVWRVFPDALVDNNGKYYGEIIATLVTQPMFAENQGGEYCQSNIEFRFGTHNGERKIISKILYLILVEETYYSQAYILRILSRI